MVHKSNTAFLEAKMLFLYIFLLSCCLPGAMGGTGDEFQANLRDLAALANKEIFFPVPKAKFQCSHVPCQLEKTIEGLKVSFKNDRARTLISLMETNMDHIISTLNRTHTQPKNPISCQMKNVSKEMVLKHYERYFQRVNENCLDS